MPDPVSPDMAASPQSALFVSKSIATRTVIPENAPFSQIIELQNIGKEEWKGYTLVRMKTYGTANAATDVLGAATDSVPVPTTKPGKTAVVTLTLKGVKSNPKSGAAQASPWELRKSDGTKVTIVTSPGNPAKGGAVWTVVTLNPLPGPNLPNLRHPAYVNPAENKYVSIGYGGQCTAFVYARIKEKLNVDLTKVSGATFGSNAAGQKWIDQLTGPGKPYSLSPTPKPHSVAVWCLNADPNQGHIAFVESVDPNGKVSYNEANAISIGSFAASNGPDSDSWGGGYDGKLRTNTAAEMQAHLGPKYALRGYIVIG